MKPSWRIVLIAGLVLVATAFHYATVPTAGALHDIYQRLYYLPVILAGLWFGVPGGLIVAVCIGVIYFPHAYHGWIGPHSLFYRLMEIGMYHVVGAVTGYLSSQARCALNAERRARRETENAYERLREKTGEILTLEEQLRRSERLAALGALSAGLAHEIRNPLGAIKAAAQFIEEEIADAVESQQEDREYLGIIVEEVNRLNRVVSDFLSYARPSKVAPEQLDVNEMLRRTIQVFETGRRSPMAIQVDYGADLPGVLIAGERLQQVFLNLLLNAEQAMERQENGRLDISSKLRKVRRITRGTSGAEYANFVEIRFSDTGPGIDPAIAQNVFIPFFTTKSRGSGLGLAVCQRIIRDAGGEIELRSQVGLGSIFSVVLPAARSERRSDADAERVRETPIS